MDCGIPFCHQGCPLGNLIPDWNDFVYRDRWQAALERLHATNNFPEFTGRLCPAPCEGSCVLGINADPVAIKSIEVSIVDRGFEEGWIVPRPPVRRTGKRVAVVGSGPAGLAAADQLNRAGHAVTVFERADRIGGLLRYGIPAFKLEKRLLDRRLSLLRDEGVEFQTGANIGVNVPIEGLRREFQAIVLAGGSTVPRDLPVPGRGLQGIHFAMEYLSEQNRRCEGDGIRRQSDHREGQARDHHRRRRHRRRLPGHGAPPGRAHRCTSSSSWARPPDVRASNNPWPTWPNVFRVSSAHEEGGERLYSISTRQFSADAQGHVTTLHAVDVQMVNKDGRMAFEPVPEASST